MQELMRSHYGGEALSDWIRLTDSTVVCMPRSRTHQESWCIMKLWLRFTLVLKRLHKENRKSLCIQMVWERFALFVNRKHTDNKKWQWQQNWRQIWSGWPSINRRLLDEMYPFGLPMQRKLNCYLCACGQMGQIHKPGKFNHKQKKVTVFDCNLQSYHYRINHQAARNHNNDYGRSSIF